MIELLGIATIFILFTCILLRKKNREMIILDGILGFMLTVFLTFTIGIITGGFLGETEKSRETYTTPIYSLRNQLQIEGQFSLGSGFVDSQEHYYFFTKDNRGSYQAFHAKACNAYIFEDEEKTPYARWQTVHYVPSIWVCYFTRKIFDRYEDTALDLHVPKNTIIQEYKVK